MYFYLFYYFFIISFLILKSLILTCIPKHEPPSHLPPHNISLGHPHAPAPSMLYPVSDIDWQFNSYMIVYMFQCHSPKSSVLTVASWPAYRFLKRQIRWSGIPISLRIFQFVVIHTVKCFGVDVFLERPCFFYDPAGVDNLISGSSAFIIFKIEGAMTD